MVDNFILIFIQINYYIILLFTIHTVSMIKILIKFFMLLDLLIDKQPSTLITPPKPHKNRSLVY
jgi:hypothetical protein